MPSLSHISPSGIANVTNTNIRAHSCIACSVGIKRSKPLVFSAAKKSGLSRIALGLLRQIVYVRAEYLGSNRNCGISVDIEFCENGLVFLRSIRNQARHSRSPRNVNALSCGRAFRGGGRRSLGPD